VGAPVAPVGGGGVDEPLEPFRRQRASPRIAAITARITTMIRIVVRLPNPLLEVDLLPGGAGAVTVTDTALETDEPIESFAQTVAVYVPALAYAWEGF